MWEVLRIPALNSDGRRLVQSSLILVHPAARRAGVATQRSAPRLRMLWRRNDAVEAINACELRPCHMGIKRQRSPGPATGFASSSGSATHTDENEETVMTGIKSIYYRSLLHAYPISVSPSPTRMDAQK